MGSWNTKMGKFSFWDYGIQEDSSKWNGILEGHNKKDFHVESLIVAGEFGQCNNNQKKRKNDKSWMFVS